MNLIGRASNLRQPNLPVGSTNAPPRRSAVKRILRIRTIQKLDILDIEGKLILIKVQCDAGTYIRSLCHHMGLALGTGAHMQELRRTRSGAFGETAMHSLQDLQDACVAAAAGDRSALNAMIISVDNAVPDLPAVVVRDTAIDAICHGAALAGVGIVRCDEFKKNQIVAVISQKQEFIGLGKTLAPSSSWKPGTTGLFIAMTAVFLAPGTYPRGWKKRSAGKELRPAGTKKDSIKKIPG